MNSSRRNHDEHLDVDAIQAFLDVGEESGQAAAGPTHEHLANCARCRSQVEAWREVFRELGQLRRFAPPGRLAERVMSGMEFPKTAARPFGMWWRLPVRRWFARPGARSHLSGRRLQDLADGALSLPRAWRAKAHLAACGRCESRFAGWRRLVAALESLPSLSPTPGFAEGVMARWRRMAEETTRRARTASNRGPWPHSLRGWALAGVLVGVPAAAFSSAAAFVSTFPQLTADDLVSYLWWQARDALSALASSVLGGLMQSGAAFRAYAFADFLIASPATAAAGGAALTTLTLAAVWVLRRNLGFTYGLPRHVGA